MIKRIKAHLEYKKTHRKLVEAMQDAVMRDESIKLDEEEFERNWLAKLRKEDDPELADLANLIEEQIKLREKEKAAE